MAVVGPGAPRLSGPARLATALSLALALGTADASAEPPAEPILRIEAGQHTAPIKRIDRDHEERFLVTGSDDKTARVWSLPEGRLLRVLRPPIGLSAHDGKVFAVAISPDGAIVAVGGYDVDWRTGNAVYLFERATGRLIRRLGGLENAVTHLAFSLDGGAVAAGLGATGVRAWRVADGTPLLADRDYEGHVYGLAFAADGRLATTSYNGHVRLYDATLRRVASRPAPDGKRPFGIAFSPDGRRIAVGYDDTRAVTLLAGDTLAPLDPAATAGIDNGTLHSVTWSADGRFLYAAGRYQEGGFNPILRWPEADAGAPARLSQGSTDSVLDLKPWGATGVLYGAGDPLIGGFDGAGRPALHRGPETADLRDQEDVLAVSGDGRRLRFGLTQWGKEPVAFDLARRRLVRDPPADPALRPARRTVAGREVPRADWKNTTQSRLGDTPLPLRPYEEARSLAATAEGDRFVLAADWSLRLFAADGKQRWEQPVPGTAWAVVIPDQGRVVVAGYGDGTVRWHRLDTGAELLVLFVHRDSVRWVAWTPQGYYDASPGGEDLIGWHVNQGLDQAAEFYPASRFRSRFYRPDIVARVLDTFETGPKQALAGVLPPVVDILAPAEAAPVADRRLTLTYLLRSPSGKPVTRLAVLIDGRPVESVANPAGESVDNPTGEIAVTLPPRDVTLSLVAETADGPGEAASVRLRWTGDKDPDKPALHLVAVGVGQYQRIGGLKFAGDDARAIVARWAGEEGEGRAFRRVNPRQLTDADADRPAIINALGALTATASEDVAIVFLSGHGVSDVYGGYSFLPREADLSNLDATALPDSDLFRLLRRVKGRVILFLDTCRAGAAAPAREAGAVSRPDVNKLVSQLSNAAEGGVIVFASSTGDETSVEMEKLGHGAFTAAVLDGLAGKADADRNRRVTVRELGDYVKGRVKELTGGKQTPVLVAPTSIDLDAFPPLALL